MLIRKIESLVSIFYKKVMMFTLHATTEVVYFCIIVLSWRVISSFLLYMLIWAEIFLCNRKKYLAFKINIHYLNKFYFTESVKNVYVSCIFSYILRKETFKIQNPQRPGELKINFPCIILNMMVRVMTRLTCALKS